MSNVSSQPKKRSYTILTLLLVILVIIAGVGGYFAGLTSAPRVQTTVTQTVTGGVGVTTGEVIKWRATTWSVPGDPYFGTIQKFAEWVKILSGGRMVIEVYAADELFPVIETLDAVAKGTVELADVFQPYWGSQDPMFAVLGLALPGPLKTGPELWYLNEKTLDLAEKAFEKWGVTLVSVFNMELYEPLMCRNPISSLDDVKGKIIRTGGYSGIFYEKLGAKTMFLSGGEIYQALKLGTVDCAEWSDFNSNYQMKFYEVAKYALEAAPDGTLHVQTHIVYLVANPKAWRELPDDLKNVVKAAAMLAFQWVTYYMDVMNREGKELWIKAGGEVVTQSPKDVEKARKAALEIYTDLAKKGGDVLEYIKRVIKVWRDLGYTDWANDLEQALKSEGLI